MEADVYPKNRPDEADVIDGSIGELSPFHSMFGYYAKGVSPETATLPSGWQDRLIPIKNANTRGATGWCLEIHELVLSKYIARREKDIDFVAAVARHGLVERDVLLQRLATMPVDEARRTLAEQRIRAHHAAARP